MPVLLNSRAVVLKRNWKIAASLALLYILGLVLGFIFYKNCDVNNVVYVNAVAYYETVALGYTNVFVIEIKFFFTAFLYVALALSCSLVAYTLPAGYCLLFIRGVVIGGAGCVMISVFKFDGLFIFIFVTFIQGLVLTAIISSIISCNLDLLRKKGCRKPDRKYKLTTSAMALAACLILTIYGIIIIGLVIRPMYAVF